MKIKIIITFALALTLSNICYSQTFAGYGIKGGLVMSYLLERRTYETINVATDSRIGATFGIFGDFFKTKYFCTTLEINFEQKGDNEKQFYPTLRDSYSTLNVLPLSLLAKISYPLSTSQIYVAVGPRFDIILSAKDRETEQGFYSNIKPISYGITFSMGAEIYISKKNALILEVSFSPDFTTSTGHYGNLLDNYYNYKSNSFEFKTGLKFNPL